MPHVHPRVAGADVGHRGLVVVQPDDAARDVGDQVGAVALAAAGLEHVAARAAVGQPLVDHLVAAEPVVLLGQAGDRALPGQGQRTLRGRPDVGDEMRSLQRQANPGTVGRRFANGSADSEAATGRQNTNFDQLW